MNAPVRTKSQILKFEDGDETIVVCVLEYPNGEYSACELINEVPQHPVGFGLSSIGAIADLFKKMPRAASEREEYNHQAARWDHARGLRS